MARVQTDKARGARPAAGRARGLGPHQECRRGQLQQPSGQHRIFPWKSHGFCDRNLFKLEHSADKGHSTRVWVGAPGPQGGEADVVPSWAGGSWGCFLGEMSGPSLDSEREKEREVQTLRKRSLRDRERQGHRERQRDTETDRDRERQRNGA